MTEDEILRSSPLVNAFRVLGRHGVRRQLPLVLAMLISSAFEGLGIGTLLRPELGGGARNHGSANGRSAFANSSTSR